MHLRVRGNLKTDDGTALDVNLAAIGSGNRVRETHNHLVVRVGEPEVMRESCGERVEEVRLGDPSGAACDHYRHFVAVVRSSRDDNGIVHELGDNVILVADRAAEVRGDCKRVSGLQCGRGDREASKAGSLRAETTLR